MKLLCSYCMTRQAIGESVAEIQVQKAIGNAGKRKAVLPRKHCCVQKENVASSQLEYTEKWRCYRSIYAVWSLICCHDPTFELPCGPQKAWKRCINRNEQASVFVWSPLSNGVFFRHELFPPFKGGGREGKKCYAIVLLPGRPICVIRSTREHAMLFWRAMRTQAAFKWRGAGIQNSASPAPLTEGNGRLILSSKVTDVSKFSEFINNTNGDSA